MNRRQMHLIPVVLAVGLALSSVAPAAVDPSLIGWWKFDDGSGTTAKDSSGNGNDGTLQGGAAWVSGVVGTALSFNGSDAYVTTGKSLVNNLTAFTFAGWVSVSNVGVYAGLFGQNDLIEFGCTTENSGQIGTWMLGNGWAFVGVNYPYPYPSWHHLVLTGDPTAVVIYVDGEERARGTGGMTTPGSTTFPFNIGGCVFNSTGQSLLGEIDDVRLYNRALAQAEIPGIMRGTPVELPASPVPSDGATDVPRDVAVVWTPGLYAQTHDVYFGTVFNDVNSASRANPMGLLASQGQDANTCDPVGLLDFGQTYYWRVDEVNAPPASTVYKGFTWRFTTETYGYRVTPVKATASGSMAATMGPEKTIDGSGLDASDQHSVSASQMWLSKKNQSPVWIQYEFDKVYKLYQMWVWNSNQAVEEVVGFGARDVTVETSVDGTTWTALADVPEFADGTGEPNYTHNTTVDFSGAQAKYVKLTITSNWVGGTKQAGLSEVRFFYMPVKAFGPSPASAATGVAVDAVLNWRPGREAVKHQVYLGTDPNALSLVNTVTTHSLGLGSLGLQYGKTYYWKVNEVNDAATPASWAGDVWSFTTIGYAVVDDFEQYNDVCKRIFFSWVDGLGYSASADCSMAGSAGNGTGSTVGNVNAPFAEKSIIHGGSQSMPMAFDNTKSPFYSEAQREWSAAQSWTGGGVNTLQVYLRGDPAVFAETSPGTIIMNGMGTDIWANSDQCRFAYKSLKGNGSIVARVDSVSNTNGWAKAGVMIRETIQAGSANGIVAMTPGNGITFQWRAMTDDVSSNMGVTGFSAPYWVKLTRTGTAITAQYSGDGAAWTDLTATTAPTFTMASDIYVGLAVCSHAANVVCGAKFSNVSTTGSVSGSWQVAEIGVAQLNGNTPETFYVAVQDNAGQMKVVSNSDPAIIATGIWEQWSIPLSQFTSAGVNVGSVRKMIVGVGNRSSPKAGGSGKLYIDDIRLTRLSAP